MALSAKKSARAFPMIAAAAGLLFAVEAAQAQMKFPEGTVFIPVSLDIIVHYVTFLINYGQSLSQFV